MVDENVCSEDQDQLLILKASRIFVATSSLLLQKKTQCNIKGLKALKGGVTEPLLHLS